MSFTYKKPKKARISRPQILGVITGDAIRYSMPPVPTNNFTHSVPVKQILQKVRARTGIPARAKLQLRHPDLDCLWPKKTIPVQEHFSRDNLLNGMSIKRLEFHTYRHTPENFRESRIRKPIHSSMGEIEDNEKKTAHKKETKPIETKEVEKESVKPNETKRVFVERRPVVKKVEFVGVKEILRNKEWLLVAKEGIYKDFFSMINKSNGIEIRPEENFKQYKYYVGKGNNQTLIKQLFNSRWWWTRVKETEISQANLIWIQGTDQSLFEKMNSIEHSPTIIGGTFQIECDTKFEVEYMQGSSFKQVDISGLNYGLISESSNYCSLEISNELSPSHTTLYNKVQGNNQITNKKGLFYNLKAYCSAIGTDPFNIMPLTFHVKHGIEDPIFKDFEEIYENFRHTPNLWIVKPGEDSNRGSGISVCSSIEQIREQVLSQDKHTVILEKYIDFPFLIHKRKFDLRCYALITSYNGVLECYFYEEGYLRTASKNFSLENTNKYIHLTNDAVQNKSEDYGKFESGNKMAYTDFQRYLDNHSELKVSFQEEILPEIKEIVKETVNSVFLKLNPYRKGHEFEVLGYDFIFDAQLKPWLLEVNTNPCLELSSSHLARIIPAMIENSFKIAIDAIFPEPEGVRKNEVSNELLLENKYHLIFHSETDGVKLVQELRANGSLDLLKEEHEVEEVYNL